MKHFLIASFVMLSSVVSSQTTMQNKQLQPNDQGKLELYQTIFPVLWKHPGVAGITFWGYVEGRLWKRNCHLEGTDGPWRPAMIWLAKYLAENPG
jgi:hypothetical protein